MDPARELAQLVQARLELRARAVEQRRQLRVALRPAARDPELHRRARPSATARRRAGRAPAAGARRRRPARAARATRAAPRSARAAPPPGAVLERERRRGARRADELGLVGERGIVLDRRDPAALQLDLGPPAAAGGRGARRRRRSGPVRQPVRHGDRRVAERLGERGPHGVAAERLASRAISAAIRSACASRLRSSPARNPNGTVASSRIESDASGSTSWPTASRPAATSEHQERHARGPDHGREHAPLRLARGAPAAPHDREADRDHDAARRRTGAGRAGPTAPGRAGRRAGSAARPPGAPRTAATGSAARSW